MTTKEIKNIRKIQAILLSIKNGKPKFFNVAQYKKLGLVIVKKRWGINASGNKVEMGYTFHLTPKANTYLNVNI